MLCSQTLRNSPKNSTSLSFSSSTTGPGSETGSKAVKSWGKKELIQVVPEKRESGGEPKSDNDSGGLKEAIEFAGVGEDVGRKGSEFKMLDVEDSAKETKASDSSSKMVSSLVKDNIAEFGRNSTSGQLVAVDAKFSMLNTFILGVPLTAPLTPLRGTETDKDKSNSNLPEKSTVIDGVAIPEKLLKKEEKKHEINEQNETNRIKNKTCSTSKKI